MKFEVITIDNHLFSVTADTFSFTESDEFVIFSEGKMLNLKHVALLRTKDIKQINRIEVNENGPEA